MIQQARYIKPQPTAHLTRTCSIVPCPLELQISFFLHCSPSLSNPFSFPIFRQIPFSPSNRVFQSHTLAFRLIARSPMFPVFPPVPTGNQDEHFGSHNLTGAIGSCLLLGPTALSWPESNHDPWVTNCYTIVQARGGHAFIYENSEVALDLFVPFSPCSPSPQL